jgi:hypothetical protein
LEEIPADDNRFIKIYGKESGSFGSTLNELPNGNLLIGGKVDVPALDFTNVGGVFDIGKVVEGAPSLIEVDPNGNQTRMNLFPIGSHLTVPEIQLSDISNKSKFLEIVQLSDGGYMVLGEWRGFDVAVSFPGYPYQVVINSDESPNTTAPFLMKLNSDMSIDFIRSMNGEANWDLVYRSKAIIRMLSDGSIGILHGLNVYDPIYGFEGYSFLKIDQQGDTLYFKDYFEPVFDTKLAHDFILNDNGDLCLIGQANNRIYFIFIEPSNDELEYAEFIDNSGMRGNNPNTNSMFLEQFNDKSFVAVYTDPPQDTRIRFVSGDYSASGEPIIISDLENEYPRAVYITENEDILIYTVYLANASVPSGFLYRVTREGKRIFRIRLEGSPGDVIEAKDGTILALSNPLFNGLIPKTRLTKLSADGRVY